MSQIYKSAHSRDIYKRQKHSKTMKKFILAILMLVAIGATSCTTAEAVVYDEEPSVDYIITYGTPYYYNGVIISYYYHGYWYYPRHHRIYYHRHDVRPHHGTGPNRPYRPHGYEPKGHKHGNHSGNHHGTRPNSRPNTIHSGGSGHGGHGGHGGSGGRPSTSPRRR